MPDSEPQGFAIIAMGKLGSRELNYSSDVDLLLLFDPGTCLDAAVTILARLPSESVAG